MMEWIPALVIVLLLAATIVCIWVFVAAVHSPWLLGAGVLCWVLFLLGVMHG